MYKKISTIINNDSRKISTFLNKNVDIYKISDITASKDDVYITNNLNIAVVHKCNVKNEYSEFIDYEFTIYLNQDGIIDIKDDSIWVKQTLLQVYNKLEVKFK